MEEEIKVEMPKAPSVVGLAWVKICALNTIGDKLTSNILNVKLLQKYHLSQKK